jgi:hypothetical protein
MILNATSSCSDVVLFHVPRETGLSKLTTVNGGVCPVKRVFTTGALRQPAFDAIGHAGG